MNEVQTVAEKHLIGRNAEERVLQALTDIFQNSKNTECIGYVLTDQELLFLINKRLPLKYKIGYSKFKQIRANAKRVLSVPQHLRAAYELLLDYFTEIAIQQKLNLHNKMMNATAGNWQKYSWWLERKWDELNIKSKVEVSAQQEYRQKIEEASEDAERLAEKYQNAEEVDYEVEDD